MLQKYRVVFARHQKPLDFAGFPQHALILALIEAIYLFI
jgi:hypothetical protein